MSMFNPSANRSERRAQERRIAKQSRKYDADFVPVELPDGAAPHDQVAAVRNKHFLVQVFLPPFGHEAMVHARVLVTPISLCDPARSFRQDELQGIKDMLGYGELHAIEVYPTAAQAKPTAQGDWRELWVLKGRLPFVGGGA